MSNIQHVLSSDSNARHMHRDALALLPVIPQGAQITTPSGYVKMVSFGIEYPNGSDADLERYIRDCWHHSVKPFSKMQVIAQEGALGRGYIGLQDDSWIDHMRQTRPELFDGQRAYVEGREQLIRYDRLDVGARMHFPLHTSEIIVSIPQGTYSQAQRFITDMLKSTHRITEGKFWTVPAEERGAENYFLAYHFEGLLLQPRYVPKLSREKVLAGWNGIRDKYDAREEVHQDVRFA